MTSGYESEYSTSSASSRDMASPESPADQPSTRWLQTVLRFVSIVVVTGIIGTAGIYFTKQYGEMRKSEAPAADWFLWLCGQDQTWEEYQDQQRARGNARIMDNEDEDYDWMQELVNDAYRGN